MRKATIIIIMALVLGATTLTAYAANLLTNPDFETGDLTGWIPFGNASHSVETGGNAAKMFGNFSGGFNVSGMFQQFSAAPGDIFTMDADSFHLASDPMIGGGAAGGGNWVVMKIAFFDAGNNEIGAAEGTILDGTYVTGTWVDNPAIMGTAPAGTVNVQALLLYLQPNFDGGAAHIDNVLFEMVDPSAVELSTVDAEANDTIWSLTSLSMLAVITIGALVWTKRETEINN